MIAPAPRLAATAPLRLRREGRLSGWAKIGIRALVALGLIGIALSVHWLDRAGLKDNVDGVISFTDVLYFTMITVTTVGYGDIVPVTDRARMFDTFVVTPIRLFLWLIFLGTAYSFVLKRTSEKWHMARIQRTLSGHVVITGYGGRGAAAARELIARGTPAHAIVAIDQDAARLESAERLGLNVLEGDATRDRVLEAARLDNARALIVSTGRDDTSILVVLTARRMAPTVSISVVVRDRDNEGLARRAGADTVVNPVSFAGLLLAGSTTGPHVTDYIADLASAEGRIDLHERPVLAAEVGRPLVEVTPGLGVRLYRNGHPHSFADLEAQALQAGDTIVEILAGPRSSRKEARGDDR